MCKKNEKESSKILLTQIFRWSLYELDSCCLVPSLGLISAQSKTISIGACWSKDFKLINYFDNLDDSVRKRIYSMSVFFGLIFHMDVIHWICGKCDFLVSFLYIILVKMLRFGVIACHVVLNKPVIFSCIPFFVIWKGGGNKRVTLQWGNLRNTT